MPLQGALSTSDTLLTVSQSYAHEIRQELNAGFGLHHVLSSRPVRYPPYLGPTLPQLCLPHVRCAHLLGLVHADLELFSGFLCLG